MSVEKWPTRHEVPTGYCYTPQPGETPARAAGAPQGPVAWSPMVVPSLVCVVREGRWSRIFNFPRGVSCMWGGWCLVFPGRPWPAVTRVSASRGRNDCGVAMGASWARVCDPRNN